MLYINTKVMVSNPFCLKQKGHILYIDCYFSPEFEYVLHEIGIASEIRTEDSMLQMSLMQNLQNGKRIKLDLTMGS